MDTSTYDIRVEYQCISRSLSVNRAISQELMLESTQNSIGKQLKSTFGFHATYGVFEVIKVFINKSIDDLSGYYINGTWIDVTTTTTVNQQQSYMHITHTTLFVSFINFFFCVPFFF